MMNNTNITTKFLYKESPEVPTNPEQRSETASEYLVRRFDTLSLEDRMGILGRMIPKYGVDPLIKAEYVELAKELVHDRKRCETLVKMIKHLKYGEIKHSINHLKYLKQQEWNLLEMYYFVEKTQVYMYGDVHAYLSKKTGKMVNSDYDNVTNFSAFLQQLYPEKQVGLLYEDADRQTGISYEDELNKYDGFKALTKFTKEMSMNGVIALDIDEGSINESDHESCAGDMKIKSRSAHVTELKNMLVVRRHKVMEDVIAEYDPSRGAYEEVEGEMIERETIDLYFGIYGAGHYYLDPKFFEREGWAFIVPRQYGSSQLDEIRPYTSNIKPYNKEMYALHEPIYEKRIVIPMLYLEIYFQNVDRSYNMTSNHPYFFAYKTSKGYVYPLREAYFNGDFNRYIEAGKGVDAFINEHGAEALVKLMWN